MLLRIDDIDCEAAWYADLKPALPLRIYPSKKGTKRMANVQELDNELNQKILAGDIMNAFEKFYAEDVVMQENFDPPKVGKATNRQAEKDFLDSVEAFHGAKMTSSAVNGDVSFSEWEYDLSFKGMGRMTMNQVAVRHWKNGQVAHERFYYKGGK